MPRLSNLSLRQLIWLCLGVITIVFLLVSAASVAGRITVARAVAELQDQVLPLQAKVSDLRRAYTDQETGLREFMLTGDPAALDAYLAGGAAAERLFAEVRGDLSGEAELEAQLDRAVEATAAWRSQAAEPEIAARRAGPILPAQRDAIDLESTRLFEAGRAELRALAARVDTLPGRVIARIHSAQRVSNAIQFGAAGVLLLVVVGTAVMVHRLLNRPLTTLVDEVRAVADGDYDQVIHGGGPREISEVSHAVETMRDTLRANTVQLVDAELRDEQARIAADLHDRTIQRVFGLGLGLTSAAGRRTPDLRPFIDETDEIIRDLREIVFNFTGPDTTTKPPLRLRTAIIDIVESAVKALGFSPTLQFVGPIDETPMEPTMIAALLSVIRESLSDTARHSQATAATVRVEMTDVDLRLRIEDNGIHAPNGDRAHRNATNSARQFDGAAEIRTTKAGQGTVVDWVIPVPHVTTAVGSQRREVVRARIPPCVPSRTM